MSRTLLVLLISLFLAAPALAETPDFQVRVPVHGTHLISTHLGVAGWLAEPDILDGQPQAWTVLGPRYQTDQWSVELLTGALFQKELPAPVYIDVRASWDPVDFVSLWGNVSYGSNFYYYAKVDTPIWKIGALGLEVEQNTFGPRLVLPFGEHLTLIGTYHNDNVVRVYAFVTFAT